MLFEINLQMLLELQSLCFILGVPLAAGHMDDIGKRNKPIILKSSNFI